jgi:fermentation-respiration switch protein FrsA (DUF1100 family)
VRWIVALIVIAAAFVGGRMYLLRRMEMDLIKVHRLGQRTPAARGLLFEELPIDSGGRALRSFYVPADGPSLLIFHGNDEAISSWVDALELLHRAGVAAMVFDYSGFGASQGEPTLAHFHEDGLAAWHAFRVRAPAGERACAYGLSLGSGVLLEVASELSPPPDCVAVSGAFLSARAAAVHLGEWPRWASWLLPDALDSLENVRELRAPLLVEQGSEDGMVPVAWAAKLAGAHPGAEVAIVKGMHHGDPVAHPSEASWGPVIRFVKSAAAPSALRGR